MYLLNHLYYFIAISTIFNSDSIIKFCLRHSIVSKSINVFLTDANIIIVQVVNQFIVQSLCESNNSTFRRFVNFSIDQLKSITSILLRSFIYKAMNNKQTKAEISYFTQFVSRSESISNLTFLSYQQSIFISFEQLSKYVHVIIFESFEFRFFSSCFSLESFISSLSIIDLSFYDNVIKSS